MVDFHGKMYPMLNKPHKIHWIHIHMVPTSTLFLMHMYVDASRYRSKLQHYTNLDLPY